MKLLVAGKTGQVARSLVEAASPLDLQLVALGRPDLDLLNADSIERALKNVAPDYVINAAAYTAVDKAEEEPLAADLVNHRGAASLAKICAARDIPLIHISTDYVFDGQKKTPYVETDETGPPGVYGLSKLRGDQAVMAAGPRHIILRTAWVYSPYGSNFVKTMLRLAQTRDELGVVDDQRGSPSYAPHIAQAILAMIAQLERFDDNRERWGIYNLAGSGEATWCDMARETFAQSQKHGGASAIVQPIDTAQYPTPAKRPANSRLDGSKLQEVFDIALPPWQDGIAQCVERLAKES